jgi:hypothetical protein
MSDIFALIFLMWIVGFAAVIWGLIDVIRVPDDSMFRAGDKIVWVLVIMFANVIGLIIYLAIGRPEPGGRRGPRQQDEFPPPPPQF